MLPRFMILGGNTGYYRVMLGARRECWVLGGSTEYYQKVLSARRKLSAQRGGWVLRRSRDRQAEVHSGRAALPLGLFTVMNHQAQPSQITWQESGVTLG